MTRLCALALVLLFAAGAAAKWQDPDGWARVSGPEIEGRIGGRAMAGQYAGEDRRFEAEFRRDGGFAERWSVPIFDAEGRERDNVRGEWFVRGDLICEKIPVLSAEPLCGAVYERLDENREAYKFVDPETGELISYSTEVWVIELLH